jgi:hypothetical protein
MLLLGAAHAAPELLIATRSRGVVVPVGTILVRETLDAGKTIVVTRETERHTIVALALVGTIGTMALTSVSR